MKIYKIKETSGTSVFLIYAKDEKEAIHILNTRHYKGHKVIDYECEEYELKEGIIDWYARI